MFLTVEVKKYDPLLISVDINLLTFLTQSIVAACFITGHYRQRRYYRTQFASCQTGKAVTPAIYVLPLSKHLGACKYQFKTRGSACGLVHTDSFHEYNERTKHTNKPFTLITQSNFSATPRSLHVHFSKYDFTEANSHAEIIFNYYLPHQANDFSFDARTVLSVVDVRKKFFQQVTVPRAMN